jgi:hypothetical protein
MGLGNRRFVVLGVSAIGVALALSGCSATGTEQDVGAVTVGQQALTLKSSGPASTTTGWSSAATCPDEVKQGILSSVPAGTPLTTLDAAKTDGIPNDPGVTSGDVPSCAYSLVISGQRVDELLFIGMGASYQTAIVSKLVADGFTAGASASTSSGSSQTFSMGMKRVVTETLQAGPLSVFAVIG